MPGGKPAGQSENLDTDEVIAAVDALSAADALRLDAAAGYFARGTGLSAEELVQDPIGAMTLGDRTCRRDLKFVIALIGAMRSLAFHERKRQFRKVALEKVGAGRTDDDDESNEVNIAADQPTAEEAIIEREFVASVDVIRDLFKEDEEAQMVLMAWEDGLKGKDLREATGLNQTGLDYAIKRIRRTTRKHYPEGWEP